MDQIKKISCDPMCGFAVQSHDEGEVVRIAGKHVKDVHNKTYSEKELKQMMTTES